MQGWVTDDQGEPLTTADVAVLIHDAPTGGDLVYFSGADFVNGVSDGVMDLMLGLDTPLQLDDTLLYHMTIVIEGAQLMGEDAGGRYAFRPGNGSHARPDLESRLDDLEAAFGVGKSEAPGAGVPASPAFGGEGVSTSLELGLLGTGLAQGTTTGASVVANLLLQPVGVFSNGVHVMSLGPFHIPRPDAPTDVEEPDLPARTVFRGCSPNPFNPSTTIRYDLAAPAAVELDIHDLAGRLVRCLRGGETEPPGRYSIAR